MYYRIKLTNYYLTVNKRTDQLLTNYYLSVNERTKELN